MKKFLMTLAVVAFFFTSSQSANAMCIYNGSDVIGLQICFSCGLFCSNSWIIEPCPSSGPPTPDCYRCRYGKGGGIMAGEPIKRVLSACVSSYHIPRLSCSNDVEDHGWIVVTGADLEHLLCKAYK